MVGLFACALFHFTTSTMRREGYLVQTMVQLTDADGLCCCRLCGGASGRARRRFQVLCRAKKKEKLVGAGIPQAACRIYETFEPLRCGQ